MPGGLNGSGIVHDALLTKLAREAHDEVEFDAV